MLPAPNHKRQPDPAASSWEVASKSAWYKAPHTDRCLFQFISVLQAGLSVGHGNLCNKVERAVSMEVGRKPRNEVKQVLSRTNAMGRRKSRRNTTLETILREQFNPQVTITRISN